MDVKEFKAWFEGFCESIGEAPTPEQFAKIKAKVATVEPVKVSFPIGPTPRTPDKWPVEPQPLRPLYLDQIVS